MRKRMIMCFWLACSATTAASATETIAYSYDANGRLIRVVHSGTVNNGVTAETTHDHADNRLRVKVTGAP